MKTCSCGPATAAFHLLRREGFAFPRGHVTKWTGRAMTGKLTANRFSTLKQIDRTNVAKLKPRWIFSNA